MAKAPGYKQTKGPPAAGTGRSLTRLVEEALRDRLGEERYAVWFGEGVSITVDIDAAAPVGGGRSVVVSAGNAFAQEWLRRTFRVDLEAVAEAVCGGGATVAWRTGEGLSVVTDAAAVSPAAAGGNPSVEGGHAIAAMAGRRGQAAPAGRRAKRATDPDGHSRTALARQRRVAVPEVESTSLAGSAHAAVSTAGSAAAKRPIAGLEGFVVGPSNRMAFAALELAATRPGEMSPLLIHGVSGVGKTHLLEGICGRFRGLRPGATCLFLSAEQFTTGFLQALHSGGLPGFRRLCRHADLLVIDDLQFFAGKRATVVELQQTVDAYHRQGRQIVFAADRDLGMLDCLGPDLITRLRGGMTARIDPPDYDVRRGIVVAVAARRGITVPDDVFHYIATHMTRHARELIGAINRLEATSHMLGVPITLDMAEEALADLVRSSSRSVRLADIERAVCSAFGIEAGSLQSARRARTVNHPRMLAMFLARRHTSSALAEIGSYFGRRSHSTVIAAQKAVDEWVARRTKIVLADATWDVEEAIRRVEDVLRAG